MGGLALMRPPLLFFSSAIGLTVGKMDFSLRRPPELAQALRATVHSWWRSALLSMQTRPVDTTGDCSMIFASRVTGVIMAFILLCDSFQIRWLRLLLLAPLVLGALARLWPTNWRAFAFSEFLRAQPHVVAALTLAAWEALHLSTASTETLTLADAARSHCAFMLQLFMMARDVPLSKRMRMLLLSFLSPFTCCDLSLATRPGSLLTLMGSALGFLCGSALSVDVRAFLQVAQQKAVLQRADSRLLHVVKGQCGGASALLKELIRQQDREVDRKKDTTATSLTEQVLEMLTQTTEWCYKREVFVQLEDGTYKSEPKEVCLHDELRAVLGPHAQIETYEKRAMVDSVIVRLLLSEVSTNAAKYSPSQEHISSQAKLVTDAAGKDWLQIFVRNANLPGSPHLSPRECEQVFEKGFKKSMPTAAPQSNGVGLSSVKLAAEAAGGDAWMTANEHHTTVYLLLPAAKCAERSESKLLCGRNVKANGLSPLRGRIISGFIDATSHTASKPSPGVGITTHFTVPMGTPRLSNKGLQSSNSNASSLVCIGIDDSPTLRRMQNFLFDVCMRANRQRSGSVGASLAEVYAYVDIVMGRKTLSLESTHDTPADIAVLDENIDLEDECVFIKGSDLARELREQGFRGIVCVLTGEDQQHVQKLAELPRVDFAFQKSADQSEIARILLQAFTERTPNRALRQARTWQPRLDVQDEAVVLPASSSGLKRRLVKASLLA